MTKIIEMGRASTATKAKFPNDINPDGSKLTVSSSVCPTVGVRQIKLGNTQQSSACYSL